MRFLATSQPRWLVSFWAGLIGLGWPMVASGDCIASFRVEQLKGKAYTYLPDSLCPRYTDMLFDTSNASPQYGGVICDRPEATYILLQELVRHDNSGQAVWKVIQVKSIVRSRPQSFVIGMGCRDVQHTSTAAPIFALVRGAPSSTYQTLAAWKVNFPDASFTDLNPQQVVCKDPFAAVGSIATKT
jgi:hypothetical protein